MTHPRIGGPLPAAFTRARTRAQAGALTGLSSEALSPEVLAGLSAERPRSEEPRPEVPSFATSVLGEGLGLGEATLALLRSQPTSRDDKADWLRETARNPEIALALSEVLGLPTVAIDTAFECPFHGRHCPARLTHGRNGEVVYHDPGFAPLKREFQTIPELAVALRTGAPKRLRPILLALWRVRLLHGTGLLTPPEVDTPHVPPDSPPAVHAARNGFVLLVRCRWFLDPEEPVPFTRSFAETWCGLARQASRRAIFELIRREVIVKVGEAESGFANPTHLYLPGTACGAAA